MEELAEDEERIRRYLLNSLSREELEEFEYRLLIDSRYLEQVSLLEEEMVDDYVCEAMSTEEQREFEASYLLTPVGREQVLFVARLRQFALATRFAQSTEGSTVTGSASTQETSPFGYLRSTLLIRRYVLVGVGALALLLAISMTVALWSLSRARIPGAQPSLSEPDLSELRTQLSEQRRQNEELSARLLREQEQRLAAERELLELERTKRDQIGADVNKIRLSSGRERGTAGGKKLIIGSGARRISLYVALKESSYGRFKVSLQDENEKEIWVADSLLARGSAHRKRIELSVPSSLLRDGDYVVKLYGVRGGAEPVEIDNYYFRAARR